jgi:hypothetical protein
MRTYIVQKHSGVLNKFNLSDAGHFALDTAGIVPFIGETADLTNAIWYSKQGQYLNAAFSLMSMIPEAGDLLGKGGKVATWILKLGPKASVLTGPVLKMALQLLKFIKNNKAKIHAAVELAGSNKTLRPFIDKINAALESFIEVVLIPLQSSFVKTHVAGSLTGGQQAFIECVQFLSNYHHKTKILESKKTNQRILKEFGFSDVGHLGLDVYGAFGDALIPGSGVAADVINAGWYAEDGEFLLAALCLISTIPFVGDALGKPIEWALKAFKEGGKLAGKGITVVIEKIASKFGPEIIEKFAKVFAEQSGKIAALFDKVASKEGGGKIAQYAGKMKSAFDEFVQMVLKVVDKPGIVAKADANVTSTGIVKAEEAIGSAAAGTAAGEIKQSFELLGVNPGATEAQIKKAFKQKALTTHPDIAGDSAEAFKELISARDAALKSVNIPEFTTTELSNAIKKAATDVNKNNLNPIDAFIKYFDKPISKEAKELMLTPEFRNKILKTKRYYKFGKFFAKAMGGDSSSSESQTSESMSLEQAYVISELMSFYETKLLLLVNR